MEINLDELEAKCRAATHGAWVLDGNPELNDGAPHLMTEDGYGIADFWGDESSLGLKQNCRNASYISATYPAVTLELIAQLRAAREQRDSLIVLVKRCANFLSGNDLSKSGLIRLLEDIKAEISAEDS